MTTLSAQGDLTMSELADRSTGMFHKMRAKEQAEQKQKVLKLGGIKCVSHVHVPLYDEKRVC